MILGGELGEALGDTIYIEFTGGIQHTLQYYTAVLI